MAVLDELEGEPTQEFLEYLYHRKEVADERMSDSESSEEARKKMMMTKKQW